MLKALVFSVLALTVAGPVSAQTRYTVSPGDRLSVTVLEDPNLNTQSLVRPDGRITLPIAGSILVDGKSPEQIRGIVQNRLAGSFNVTPTVNVALINTALAPNVPVTPAMIGSVFVIGQVTKPGKVDLITPRRVLQALAEAEGLTPFARGEKIQIRRIDLETGEETIFPFNYDDIEEGKAVATNILLKDGDVIVVPERGLFD